MNQLNQLNKEDEVNVKERLINTKAENVWKLGDYRSISTMLPHIFGIGVVMVALIPDQYLTQSL